MQKLLLKCFAAETFRQDSTHIYIYIHPLALLSAHHPHYISLVVPSGWFWACILLPALCFKVSSPTPSCPLPTDPTPSSQLDLLSSSFYLSAFQTLLFLNIVGLKSYSHFLKCFLCFPQNSLQLEKAKAHLPNLAKYLHLGLYSGSNFLFKHVSLDSMPFSSILCVDHLVSKLKKTSSNCGDTDYNYAWKRALYGTNVTFILFSLI